MEDVQLPGQAGNALERDSGEAKHGESAQFNSGSRSHEASKPFGSSGASGIALTSSYQSGLVKAGAPEATSRSFAAFRPADAFVDILKIRLYRRNGTRNSRSRECARGRREPRGKGIERTNRRRRVAIPTRCASSTGRSGNDESR